MERVGEQVIHLTTICKLDFIDAIKVLLGRTIVTKTKVYIPQEQEIFRVNTSSSTTIESSTKYFQRKDKPDFGYSPKEELK